MDQTISVVIPAYNSEAYIETAICSVLNQTLQPMEIIIIDDGSSDGTVSVIQNLAAQYPQIRFFQNGRNCGVSITRNRGVAAAHGAWVAFLDSDDQWQPEKLEKQMALLQETNGDFCFTGSSYVDECGNPYEGMFSVPETVDRKQLLRQNVISCSSVLIRKDIMAKHPMESDRIHEDFAAWLRILEEVPVAYGLNEPLLIYRISSDSKSGNKLKSFKMNYQTYRSVGLNPFKAMENMFWYTKNGLKKYRNIKK